MDSLAFFYLFFDFWEKTSQHAAKFMSLRERDEYTTVE